MVSISPALWRRLVTSILCLTTEFIKKNVLIFSFLNPSSFWIEDVIETASKPFFVMAHKIIFRKKHSIKLLQLAQSNKLEIPAKSKSNSFLSEVIGNILGLLKILTHS